MIKFVYFDIGGVVVKDFSGNNKWNEMKKFMGVKKNLKRNLINFTTNMKMMNFA